MQKLDYFLMRKYMLYAVNKLEENAAKRIIAIVKGDIP